MRVATFALPGAARVGEDPDLGRDRVSPDRRPVGVALDDDQRHCIGLGEGVAPSGKLSGIPETGQASVTERQLLARIRTFAGSPAKRYLPR